jgi:hypothetical protein
VLSHERDASKPGYTRIDFAGEARTGADPSLALVQERSITTSQHEPAGVRRMMPERTMDAP